MAKTNTVKILEGFITWAGEYEKKSGKHLGKELIISKLESVIKENSQNILAADRLLLNDLLGRVKKTSDPSKALILISEQMFNANGW